MFTRLKSVWGASCDEVDIFVRSGNPISGFIIKYYKTDGRSLFWLALAITSAVLILATTTVLAEMKTFEEERAAYLKMYCKGGYINKVITQNEFKAVLSRHQAWYHDFDTKQKRESDGAKNDPRFANLCGANLVGLNLSGAELAGMNLSGANMSSQNLRRANFSFADLSWADLRSANFTEAFLGRANLSGVDLAFANLSGAALWYANLSGAKLYEANLSRAVLAGANMSGVLFQPKELPPIDYIALSENLAQMHYVTTPQSLVKLRKAFNESGFREQERAITYAIKHNVKWSDNTVLGKLENVFKYVFFDLPTQWGMYPGRALRILVVLIGIFSIPYIIALRYPGHGRIYRRWGSNNTPIAFASTMHRKRRTTPTTPEGAESLQYYWKLAILTGLHFSLLSAFHIGFREFNVGNWISRLQAHDYALYATGWVRSVAGTQSLISVYLLAMWALTYFGRPFD